MPSDALPANVATRRARRDFALHRQLLLKIQSILKRTLPWTDANRWKATYAAAAAAAAAAAVTTALSSDLHRAVHSSVSVWRHGVRFAACIASLA